MGLQSQNLTETFGFKNLACFNADFFLVAVVLFRHLRCPIRGVKMVYKRVSGGGGEKLLNPSFKSFWLCFPLFCDTDTWILNNI